MPSVISFGELLIDFVPTISNVTLIEAPAFKKAPGGAPANVAVGLARLGISVGFMGKVGDDAFGHFLSKVLSENHVDISALRYSQEARTALAFVSLGADGEREFMFYRNPSADMLYSPDEIDHDYIGKANLFHFGSISLISEPSRSATFAALTSAKQKDLFISYDPNLRLNLWPGETAAREGIMSAWSLANFIKVSEEELQFVSGEKDIMAAAEKLWHRDLFLLIVTKGNQGCTYISQEFKGDVPGYQVDPVDTTGAGDGFVAGLIHGLLKNPGCWKRPEAIEMVCLFANAVGALTTTERGAIPALPTMQQVMQFMNSQ